MKGDFTRDTFNPANHYTRVLMQQGRVQLDADFNEQGAIAQHYLTTLAADLIGPHGGPVDNLGFAVITDPAELPMLRDGYGRPLSDELVRRLEQGLNRGGFIIGPGRYYVAGAMCENEAPLLYTTQTGYPFDGATMPDALRGAAEFLIYLDVWERHVSYLEDGLVREVALGGPDTTSRAQLSWQVRILPDFAAGDNSVETRLMERLGQGTCVLRARAKQPDTNADPCTTDPEARYRGTENQLYRVEIHRKGSAAVAGQESGATFKWSRENGSVVLPLAAPAIPDATTGNSTVQLLTLGRDEELGLTVGGWVELVDDGYSVRHDAGPLLQVHSINRDELTVKLRGIPAPGVGTDVSAHPFLRRWDHGDASVVDGALPVAEAGTPNAGWLNLEDGIQVQFPAAFLPDRPNYYRTGDYWLIPARTATGEVEWPGQDRRDPQARPPRGEKHAYAPLALGSINSDGFLSLQQPDLRKRMTPQAK